MAKQRTDTEAVLKLVIDGKQAQTSIKELKDSYYKLSAEIQNMKREDNPAEYDDKIRKIQAIKRAWEEASREIRGVTEETKELRISMADLAKQAAGGIIGAFSIQTLKEGLETLITKNAELSDIMAGVQKTTGLTEDAVDRLNEKFKSIDTRTANTELLGLAQVAGKLGYSSEKDVEGFVRAADRIGVALGEDLGGVESSVQSLGKLVDIFKVKDQFGLEEALMKVGSAINSLGASGSAAEENLVDFTQRLAGIAPAAGISLADTLGLAATLDELGQSMESGATATGQFIVALGKDIPKNAKIAQMSVADFTELLKTDANEAFIRVLENARTAGGGLEALANNMGVMEVAGARGIAALGALAENTDMLRRRQQLSREEFSKGSSIIDEFNTVNNTLGANLDKIGNQIKVLWENSKLREWFTDLTAALVLNNNAFEKSIEVFEKQKEKVENLESSVYPLLRSYEELSIKTNKNKTEQYELEKAVKSLAEQYPLAVTEVDAYGNAISISTVKVRQLIDAEKILMKQRNADAIETGLNELVAAQRKMDEFRDQINKREKTVRVGGYKDGFWQTLKLSNEELIEAGKQFSDAEKNVQAIQVKLNKLGYVTPVLTTREQQADFRMAESRFDWLKEQYNIIQKKKKDNIKLTKEERDAEIEYLKAIGKYKEEEKPNLLTPNKKPEKKKPKSDAEKAKEEYEKLLKEEKLFAAAQLISQQEGNAKEIAEEEAKYQKRIDAWKEFQSTVGTTPEQKNDAQEKEKELVKEKENSVNKLRVKHEEEANRKISELREQLANRHETEYQKEIIRINKYYDQLINQNKGNIDEVSRIEKERQSELSNAGIREEERLFKEKERLEGEFLQGKKGSLAYEESLIDAKYTVELRKLKDQFSEKLHLHSEYLAAVKILEDARDAEKASKREEQKKAIKEAAIGAAEDLANATFSIVSNNINSELNSKLSSINKQREEELSNKNLTESQKKAINEKYDKQEKAAKSKAWKAQQKADLLQAGINTALGVTKALATSPWPLNFINAAAVGLAGAAQIAVIASKKAPEFKKGGFIPEGPTHSEGGIDLIDTRRRKLIGNIEGGEPILSTNTYANNREIIDELLYSSQRRNGARISLNPDLIKAEYESRRGVSISQTPIVQISNPQTDNSEMIKLLQQLIDKREISNSNNVVINYRMLEDANEKVAIIRNNANA
ncbi:phage tail tape measure protein [Sphingobacterium spiritivorum]|uniref:phage tail tape measure protein n=1 Tax=Sphingobacterium spiritivorum TaxID=258 RepID=UPI003DA67937